MASEQSHVQRFTRTERTLHWAHATAFLLLLATGVALYAPWFGEAIGRRPLLKELHLLTAVGWVFALVLIVAFGDRRALRQAAAEVDAFDADDLRWLRGRRAPQGRFNAGQKLNVVLTAAFTVLFAVSGTLLWLGERDTRFRLDGSLVLHDVLTLVSLLVLTGHLYLAVVHPATRHALRGITRGDVRRDWAEEHHAKWLDGDAHRGG